MEYADQTMKHILNGNRTFVSAAKSECQIHDKIFAHHGKYYVTYHEISDLGIAALNNDVDSLDDLIIKVGAGIFSLY